MSISLSPINKRVVSFGVRGTAPLIMHQWDEKAKRQMREKHAGKKTKNREARNPEAEALAATYTTAGGEIGINVLAVKSALITAAHKDIGIEKTLVRKALFIRCNDPGNVQPIEFDGDPTLREDVVRVGMGSTDLRYRHEFSNWRARFTFEIDADMIQEKDLLTLVDRAGFGVGIGDWRPEKGGEYGRFEVDPDVEVKSEK